MCVQLNRCFVVCVAGLQMYSKVKCVCVCVDFV